MATACKERLRLGGNKVLLGKRCHTAAILATTLGSQDETPIWMNGETARTFNGHWDKKKKNEPFYWPHLPW